MSKIIVKYELSRDAMKRIAIATGNEPSASQELVLEMADMTPEQREFLLARREWSVVKVEKSIVDSLGDMAKRWDEKSTLLTDVNVVIAAIKQAESTKEQVEAEVEKNAIAKNNEAIDKCREFLDGAGLNFYIPTTRSNAINTQETSDIISRCRETAAQRRAEYEREKQSAEEKKEKDRTDWIASHGSDQLKRGVKAGHSCTRLYILERAAAKFPGWIVDYNNSAAWKDRACPSIGALNDLDEANAAYPDLSPFIVWLTSEPAFDVPGDDDSYDDSYENEFDPCEALVIKDWLGKYDLVKQI